MKKNNKKDYISFLIIIALVLTYVLVVTKGFKYIYGSTVDWDCQHWAIPEYFRNLFYSSGKILPNFAFNIGNGQNIFYLSYYGLLSPIILLSYLFPFIKMIDYIQIISIIGVIASSILLYKWLSNKFTRKISLLSTILFVTTAPILFHSHRHIMFTSYMPFLILALIGVDKYFESNRKILLTVSIFLLIMTNYFFSVSAIFCILVYGICVFFQKNNDITIKKVFKEGFKFLIPVIIGILMSALLILPTFYILLTGRSETNTTIDIMSLLIPSMSIEKLFYSAYSIGLTALSFISLIKNIIGKEKNSQLLSLILLIMLVFPVFAYILNGTMYVDYKVFITFVPLLILAVSYTLKKYTTDNNNKNNIIALIAGLIVFILSPKHAIKILFISELIIIGTLLFLGNKLQKKKSILIAIVAFSSIATMINTLFLDGLYERKLQTNIDNSSYEDIVERLVNEDNNIYRVSNQNYKLQNLNRVANNKYYISTIYSSTSNKNYKDYFYELSGSEITERSYGKINSSMNIFYNMYNGNKYFIKDKYVPIGYTLAKDDLYINEDVIPIIYASNNLMSEKKFNQLEFPYNMEALLENIIINDDSIETNWTSDIKTFVGNVTIVEKSDKLEIKQENNNYVVHSEAKSNLKLEISNMKENEILIIKFDLENNNKCKNDLSITINGSENVLSCKTWKYHNQNRTFKYTISSKEIISVLDITFSKGDFIISNMEMFKINYNDISKTKSYIDEFIFDSKENSDHITGKINVTNDGYLYMSIPYDKGFKFYLNDQEVKYEIVDKYFIGIKVKKGTYNVKIEYNSPLLKEGLVLSSIGFLAFLAIIYKEKIKNKKKA